jgi:transaldolase
MNPTRQLRAIGQSLWLDYITRGVLTSGTLRRYLSDLSVTGLTSNPTIFDQAISRTDFYDGAIRRKSGEGSSGEQLFFDLAVEDLGQAADLFRPIHDQTQGADGWVSLEVSPLLAYDTRSTIAAARALHARADRPNLFIKIPGTAQGLPAIEESIFAGVPINVTLLFSREHYLAAVNAYMRGIERRLAAGLDPRVHSVASVFISRWDKAASGKVPDDLNGRVGIAIAGRTYRAYRELLASDRWQGLAAAGAVQQRLLWGSTGTKDPALSDVLYVLGLAAPDTINTMPEATLLAFADHGMVGELMRPDGGDAEVVLGRVGQAGVDVGALAMQLQREGVESFAASWKDLLRCIESKAAALRDPAVTGGPVR